MGAVAIFKGKLVKFLAKAGILVPARPDAERSLTPTAGETAFNTTANKLEVYNGTSWDQLGAASGTGLVHPTTGSTFEYGKANGSMTGEYNTAIGVDAAAKITTGSNNQALGWKALENVTSGQLNIAIGNRSLPALTNGLNNIAVGTFALYSETSGYSTIAIGGNAFASLNNAAGYGQNVGIGYGVCPDLTSGYGNVVIGDSAGDHGMGMPWSNSNKNVLIGSNIEVSTSLSSVEEAVAIGYQVTVLASNQFILGKTNHRYYLPGKVESNLAIGSLSGTPKSLRFYDGDESNFVALKAASSIASDVTWTLPAADGSASQVLTTNGSGTLSWTTTIPATLENGAYKVVNGVYNPTTDSVSGVVDANLGNSFRDTNTGSRTIAIHNLKDGQSVNIMVQGAVNNVITITAFSDAGITSVPVKYGAGQSGTMASTYSLFTVYRIGGAFNFATVGPVHGIT